MQERGIGVIGVGNMGLAMVERLRERGYREMVAMLAAAEAR